MNRSSNVWSACFLALVMIAAAIPVAGQNTGGASSAPSTDRMLKLMQAEQLVAKEEAALGRAYDSAYRARIVDKLASKSLDSLSALWNSGGSVSTDAIGVGDAGDNLVFFPVAPCRIIDTRLAGGPIPAGGTRNFFAAGAGFAGQGGVAGSCGVPFGPATAVVINFVAVSSAGAGDLRVWPFGQPVPLASAINYIPGAAVANGFPQPICNPAVSGCGTDITVLSDSAPIQIVADVLGYFARPSTPLTQNLWASVNADGSLARGFRSTGSSLISGFTGAYEIVFDGNVTGCAYVADPGNSGAGTAPPGFATTAARSGNANAVFVQTSNVAGTATNANFHLLVMCPASPAAP